MVAHDFSGCHLPIAYVARTTAAAGVTSSEEQNFSDNVGAKIAESAFHMPG